MLQSLFITGYRVVWGSIVNNFTNGGRGGGVFKNISLGGVVTIIIIILHFAECNIIVLSAIT